jgi:phage tail protein X
MGRYSNIEIQKNNSNKRVRVTTKFPIIEPTVNDTYITSQVGDRLDTLAHKYYGRSSYWWIIALANNIGKGTLSVPTGIQIRIPADSESIIEQYNELNS